MTATQEVQYAPGVSRRKLPSERQSITHRFSIAGHEGYITVGLYEEGTPGEIFITMAKAGSTIAGLMDSIAVLTSISLQHGVALKVLVDKFANVRFEPSGWTGNQSIPYAKSIIDYIFRWLGTKFVSPEYGMSDAGEGADLSPTEDDRQDALSFGHGRESGTLVCAESAALTMPNGDFSKCSDCAGTGECS